MWKVCKDVEVNVKQLVVGSPPKTGTSEIITQQISRVFYNFHSNIEQDRYALNNVHQRYWILDL